MAERGDVIAAAEAIGQQLVVLDVSSDSEFETAFATLVARGVRALYVGTGTSFSTVEIGSSRWRPAMQFQQFTHSARRSWLVA
jgi:hypothetical protein